MTTGTAVRTVRADEHAEVGELSVAAYAADLPLTEEYAAMLRDVAARAARGTVLVARTEEGVLGSLTLAPAGSRYADLALPGELEVRMLAVAPHAQRRGVAERLLRAAVELAREDGYRALVLSVISTDGPRAPHRLYERVGFRRDAARDYVGDWEPHPPMWFYELPLGDGVTGVGRAGG